MSGAAAGHRPPIAFVEHADAFEDFYPRHGVTQEAFACVWHGSGNHAFARLLQQAVGEVVWYEFSVAPAGAERRHGWAGCLVRFVPTSWLHRRMWHAFYLSPHGWRLKRWYPAFALLATYAAAVSWPFVTALRRQRPSVVFCQDYSNGRFDLLVLLRRWIGFKLVAYHAGSTPERYLGKALKRWTIRRADRLLVSSRREAEMLQVRYRVAPERVEVLLTPVDLEAFAPQPRVEACRAAGLAPEMRYALFVGRLDDRVKRVGLLIDVFAGLARGRRDLVLLIAGDGEDRQALEARARAVAPQAVRFLGWCGGATQLAPLYAAAECLVLVSRSEGFPTVIGEAMACGLPVVATDVGGVAEMVENGATGWLLPDGADEHVSAELRRALGEALCGEAQSASMRTRARRAAEDCLASDRIGQRLRQICEGTA